MSNPKTPDSPKPANPAGNNPTHPGSGMGGNTDENLRQGQHRVSDHDGDNRRGAKDGRKGS
ncbi:MAG: hypothetical protein V4850_10125 [Myxococcota bacterium]